MAALVVADGLVPMFTVGIGVTRNERIMRLKISDTVGVVSLVLSLDMLST